MSTSSLSHSLTLDIPSSIYESLVNVATRNGQQPEELAVHWLTIALQQYPDDPIEAFIGAFSSNTPDWVDRHDHYLGQAFASSMDSLEPNQD